MVARRKVLISWASRCVNPTSRPTFHFKSPKLTGFLSLFLSRLNFLSFILNIFACSFYPPHRLLFPFCFEWIARHVNDLDHPLCFHNFRLNNRVELFKWHFNVNLNRCHWYYVLIGGNCLTAVKRKIWYKNNGRKIFKFWSDCIQLQLTMKKKNFIRLTHYCHKAGCLPC